MRTKLLKRLRKEAELQYKVYRANKGFYVMQRLRDYDEKWTYKRRTISPFMSYDMAVKECDSLRRQYILTKARSMTKLRKNRFVY